MIDNENKSLKIPQVGGNINQEESVSTEPMLQFLVFKIENEEYALDVLSVEGIVGVTNITPVPGSPSYMKGLINLRGNILHLVDIRVRFGVPRSEGHNINDDVIIVIATPLRRFGILADMVSDVITVYESQITETPIENTKGLQISHVIRLDNKVVMVLPVDEIIKAEANNNK